LNLYENIDAVRSVYDGNCKSGYRPKKFNYTDPAILVGISAKLTGSILNQKALHLS